MTAITADVIAHQNKLYTELWMAHLLYVYTVISTTSKNSSKHDIKTTQNRSDMVNVLIRLS